VTLEMLLLCLGAALLELDTTYAFQSTLSRGIVAGPLFALLTGDYAAGIQVGVFTELLFADINPLGAILPPSAVICCAIALALNAMGITLCYAFIVAVVGALLFVQVERRVRKQRVHLLTSWEKQIMNKPETINRVIFLELGACFLINFVLISLFIGISGAAMRWLQPHIPQRAFFACQFAFMAVPWIGLASLIPEFRLKKR